ncbi:MAG: NYN domain-containing protein [Clostridiales bacterium]|nr:NYN domain-containing protein [Clostridiales bacterium]
MKDYLIIDGYNIINAWPKLKDIATDSYDEARRELIEMMAEYQSFKGINIIIVFDAHMVKGNIGKRDKIKGIKIVFTKEGETADSYIEKVIPQLSKRNYVTVVTNDWAEQQMILGAGATRMTTRELIIDYNNAKNRISQKTDDLSREKNMLSNQIDPEILEKLERLRRMQ